MATTRTATGTSRSRGSGIPKDRRPDLKQIQAGIASAADGAVPVFCRALQRRRRRGFPGGRGDGGAAPPGRAAPVPARRGLEVVVLPQHRRDDRGARSTFLAPASKSFVPAAVLAGCDYATATPVPLRRRRATLHRPPDQRGHYRVVEDTMTITGPRKSDPRYHAAARVRATPRPAPAPPDHARSQETRPGPRRPGPAVARAGLAPLPAPSRRSPPGSPPSPASAASATTCAPPSAPTTMDGQPCDWHFDQAALDAEAATDGWYALLTNLPATVTRRAGAGPATRTSPAPANAATTT